MTALSTPCSRGKSGAVEVLLQEQVPIILIRLEGHCSEFARIAQTPLRRDEDLLEELSDGDVAIRRDGLNSWRRDGAVTRDYLAVQGRFLPRDDRAANLARLDVQRRRPEILVQRTVLCCEEHFLLASLCEYLARLDVSEAAAAEVELRPTVFDCHCPKVPLVPFHWSWPLLAFRPAFAGCGPPWLLLLGWEDVRLERPFLMLKTEYLKTVPQSKGFWVATKQRLARVALAQQLEVMDSSHD